MKFSESMEDERSLGELKTSTNARRGDEVMLDLPAQIG